MSKRKWDEEGSPGPAASKMRSDSPSVAGTGSAMDAAAKIAAQLAAQYAAGGAKAFTPGGPLGNDQREAKDPEFVKDVEINDLRNRYMLTKGGSQAQIRTDTGATVSTKGTWYPDKTRATGDAPPLYLHITAETKESLDKGVAAVQALIDQELGPLTERPGFRDREPRERRRWPEEKIPIGFESLRNFNIRAKIVGPAGLFVKHIQQETNTKVQIKGIGSGFIDPETGVEAPEPMHIAVVGPDESQVVRAKEMAEDLLSVVKEKWTEAKTVLDQSGGQQGYGTYNSYNSYGYTGSYQQQGGEAPPQPAAAYQQPPPPGSDQASQAAQTPEQQAYWAQIMANPEYKAYYEQYYAAYYASQQQQAQQGAPPPPPSGSAPPPPPPSNQPPPPPPSGGQYSAVPPPPGL